MLSGKSIVYIIYVNKGKKKVKTGKT